MQTLNRPARNLASIPTHIIGFVTLSSFLTSEIDENQAGLSSRGVVYDVLIL